MQAKQVTPQDIYEAALRIFSQTELQDMIQPQRLSLMSMLERRLLEEEAPTQDELEGIKILLLEHLWPPELRLAHDIAHLSDAEANEIGLSLATRDAMAQKLGIDKK